MWVCLGTPLKWHRFYVKTVALMEELRETATWDNIVESTRTVYVGWEMQGCCWASVWSAGDMEGYSNLESIIDW